MSFFYRLHLESFVGSSSSCCALLPLQAPPLASGSAERSSKLIINNEISSASDRMGAVERLNEKYNGKSAFGVRSCVIGKINLPITSEHRNLSPVIESDMKLLS